MDRDAFQIETRADSMVRAAQSLYLLSDSLKLSLLLSQSQASEAHDDSVQQLIRDTERHKRECSDILAKQWLAGASNPVPRDEPQSSSSTDARKLRPSPLTMNTGVHADAEDDSQSLATSLFSATDTSSPKGRAHDV